MRRLLASKNGRCAPSRMLDALAFVIALAICAPPTMAQIQQDWVNIEGGLAGVAVGVDYAGNIYTTGASTNMAGTGFRRDMLIFKYRPDGTLLWSRQYNNDDDPTNQDDDPAWLAVDSQGNVVVTGNTHTNGTGDEAVTLKYDPDGNLLWERLHGGPGVTGDYAFFVVTDSEDNVYVTGRTFGANWDFLTFKYDADGNLLWSRQRDFGANGPDEPSGIAVDASQRVVVVGENWNNNLVAVVYDADGGELWSAKLEDPGTIIYTTTHVAFDSQSAVWISGMKGGLVLIVKYSIDGTLLFERTYEDGLPRWIDVDSLDNAIVTGTANNDLLTMKVDPDGQPLWSATLDIGGGEIGTNVTVMNNDDVVVAGDASLQVWVLARYDAQGNELWSLTADPGGIITNAPRMMAVDANENIAVTGTTPIATGRFVPTSTGPTTGLVFSSATELDWHIAGGATRSDVLRGDLGALHSHASVGDATCQAENLPVATWNDTAIPDPGAGFYYLIRGDDTQRGTGTYDNPPDLADPNEGRDSEVATNNGWDCGI